MEKNAKAESLTEPKILLITKQEFSSPRDGGTMRTHAVHNEMLKRRMDVTALSVEAPSEHATRRSPRTSFNNVLPKIKVLFNYIRIGSLSSIRWFRPSMVDRIIQEIGDDAVDCVIIEYTQLMGYACLFDMPIVLDMHNIESELLENYAKSSSSRLRRVVASHEARRLKKLEHGLSREVHVLSAVSSHDAEIAKTWREGHPEQNAKIVLAANGVSDVGFLVESDRTPDVVFVAHLGWQPNVDAAKWLAREVWPLVVKLDPTLRLRLIGRAPSDEVMSLAGPGITVHGDVASVVEHVASARVATAPLLAAGGTRLKILEALSCGTPVVATSLGALGLEGLAGPSLVIADKPGEFADQIVRLAHRDTDRSPERALVESYRWATTLWELGEEVESMAETKFQSRTNIRKRTVAKDSHG